MTSEAQPFPTCKRGHPRTPENVTRDGRCKPCKYAGLRAACANLRAAALDAYGRECACCGESIERFLTIDHVGGDGAAHRREIGHRPSDLHRWMKRNSYPDGFQTLCANCNAGKQVNGGVCPHNADTAPADNRKARHDRKLKVDAVTAYGGKCACCGEMGIMFLCIDHVSGDGAEHRRAIDVSPGAGFYRWLRNNAWPVGFRVLCWNCNDGRHLNGGVCPHEDA